MEIFLKKQNGVITVMISLILVGIMSTSSLLMEIARYRSNQAILAEVTDSASFSMLSNYDKDLLKRFGLLAVSNKVDTNQYIDYLKANTNSDFSNIQKIENMFEIMEDESSLEGIYALNDISVLKRQILEFSNYRAPYDVVKNVTNLDNLIKSLKEKIGELIPILNVFESATKIVEKSLKTFKASIEYNESLKKLEEKEKEFNENYEKLRENLNKKIKYTSDNKPVKPKQPKEIEKMPNTLERYLELYNVKELEDLVKEDQELKEPKEDDFISDSENTAKEKYSEALELYNNEYKKGKNQWEVYRKKLKKYKGDMKTYEKEQDKYNNDVQKYENKIIEYNNLLLELKDKYLDSIEGFKEAIADYNEKSQSFQRSYSDVASESLKGAIAEEKNNYLEEIKNNNEEEKKSKLKDFDEKTKEIKQSVTDFHGVLNMINDACNTFSDIKLKEDEEKLSEYYREIEKHNITETMEIEQLKKCNIQLTSIKIANGVSAFAAPLAEIEKVIGSLSEDLKKLSSLTGFMLDSADASTFDVSYNVTIEESYFKSLPSQNTVINSSALEDTQDKTSVINMLNDSEGVANNIGYDVSKLYPNNRESSVNLILQNDTEQLMKDLSNIVELVPEVVGIHLNIIKQIQKLLELIGTFGAFIMHLATFCSHIVINIVKIVYESFLITQYAVRMFPDRTTVKDGKNLNGNKYASFERYFGQKSTLSQRLTYMAMPKFELVEIIYPTFGQLRSGLLNNEDTSFSGAELEYIYTGSQSEAQNQRVVYSTLFFIRYILNIFSCTGNTTVRASIHIPIVGILIFLLWVGVETYVDLKILTLFKQGVPIVKLPSQVYLSAEGIDDLVKKFKKGFKSLTADCSKEEEKEFVNDMKKNFKKFEENFTKNMDIESSKEEINMENGEEDESNDTKSEDKTFWEKTKEDMITNLQEFTYTEHMNLLLYFVSNQKKLKRMQDIIQMEVNHKKKIDGKIESFELREAYTYLRVKSKARYKPILPMPSISGANDGYLIIDKIYYAGY